MVDCWFEAVGSCVDFILPCVLKMITLFYIYSLTPTLFILKAWSRLTFSLSNDVRSEQYHLYHNLNIETLSVCLKQ